MTRKSFQPQFEAPILAGTKRHTIRATPKRLPKIGEEFVGFIWTGKPYRSPQREFFKSTVERVCTVEIVADHLIFVNGGILSWADCCAFAAADGFQTPSHLGAWFQDNHGLPFTGILIEWAQPVTPLGALGVLAVQPAAESRP
jgi:hypothetical protein